MGNSMGINMIGRKNIVGKLINFRGLVYAPVEENGVIFLFSKLTNDLNLYIETIRKGFPDCIAKRYVGNRQWEEVNIEFEHKAKEAIKKSLERIKVAITNNENTGWYSEVE